MSEEATSSGQAETSQPSVNEQPVDNKSTVDNKSDVANNATTENKQQVDDILNKTVKVKVDGKEQEITVAQAIKNYQLAKTSYERIEQSTKLRKEIEALMEETRQDPTKLFRYIGKNPDEWAETYLSQKIKQEMMSPEQREAAMLKEKVRQYEEEKRIHEEKIKQSEYEQIVNQEKANIENEIIQVIDKMDLPKTPETIAEIAKVKHDWLSKGYDIPWDHCVDVVKERTVQRLNAIMSSMSEEQLLKHFPEIILNKLRKADLSRLRKAQTTPPEIVQPKEDTVKPFEKRTNSAKKMSMKEFMSKISG